MGILAAGSAYAHQRTGILEQLKAWPSAELEKFACKLLVLAQPKFHGSKIIHYANGEPKKLIDNLTRDL